VSADHLPDDWARALGPVLASTQHRALDDFLTARAAVGAAIYPSAADRFRAFHLTPLAAVEVVILGQDPYHRPGQAHGLSFSVPPGVRPPPSLANIFKELVSDLGIARADHGCLDHWARQGVLLLNTVLTVEEGKPASHRNRGWERLTDAAIAAVAARSQPSVFMLWGAHAQRKADLIDPARHLVLKAAHPSPLSAYAGFFGSRPFSQANAFLSAHCRRPIDWSLSPADCGQPSVASEPAGQVDC
jgi:uracil-DNA glycosylase